jgi:hypothetical protein
MQIPLAEKLFPEIRREFERITLVRDVRLAYFNNTAITSTRLNKLKWIETKTRNIGGGGILVRIPANLTSDYYMILHLGFKDIDVPELIVGQIRHCLADEENRFNAGVEFVVRESFGQKLPRQLIRNLPEDLLAFNRRNRIVLADYLEKYFKND